MYASPLGYLRDNRVAAVHFLIKYTPSRQHCFARKDILQWPPGLW